MDGRSISDHRALDNCSHIPALAPFSYTLDLFFFSNLFDYHTTLFKTLCLQVLSFSNFFLPLSCAYAIHTYTYSDEFLFSVVAVVVFS